MIKDAKNAILIIIIAFILMPMLPTLVNNFYGSSEESINYNDYAAITAIDYEAELVDEPNESGKVIITETLTYDVHAASSSNLFWELWRDLPESYVDGLKVDYKVNYVKQIYPDGTKIDYTESPKLYWDDSDYTDYPYGPGKWYHSVGPYNEDLAMYECLLFYVDGLYRERVTFEIQYEMNNAALRYGDVSELYLSMYSGNTIKYLSSFKGEIKIPNKDMPSEENFTARTLGTKTYGFEYTESDTKNPGYHTFSFDLDSNDLQFSKNDKYLEFLLLSYNKDKHIFTDYAPRNNYYDDPYLNEAMTRVSNYDNLEENIMRSKIIFLICSIIISILIICYIYWHCKKINKKYTFYKPSMQFEYFREIPSDIDLYFATALLFSKQKKKLDMGNIYASLMLSLVRKGYIKLERIDQSKDWKSNNISIKILYYPNKTNNIALNNNLSNLESNITTSQTIDKYNLNGKKLENLSINEQSFFNLIIKYSNQTNITLKQFQDKIYNDYNNTETFTESIKNSIEEIGVANSYFQKANYLEVKNKKLSLGQTCLILAFVVIVFGNLFIANSDLGLAYGSLFIIGFTLIGCFIYLSVTAKKYILLTQLGEDEYTKWKDLYKFFKDGTLMKEKTIVELPLWEKYLVYATAFGISEKIINNIKVNCTNIYESELLSNEYYRSRSFRTYSHSFYHSAYRSSSSSASYRSSGSRYGGGGRGGGGGGGGH